MPRQMTNGRCHNDDVHPGGYLTAPSNGLPQLEGNRSNIDMTSVRIHHHHVVASEAL